MNAVKGQARKGGADAPLTAKARGRKSPTTKRCQKKRWSCSCLVVLFLALVRSGSLSVPDVVPVWGRSWRFRSSVCRFRRSGFPSVASALLAAGFVVGRLALAVGLLPVPASVVLGLWFLRLVGVRFVLPALSGGLVPPLSVVSPGRCSCSGRSCLLRRSLIRCLAAAVAAASPPLPLLLEIHITKKRR